MASRLNLRLAASADMSGQYRPEVLRLANPDQRARWEGLLADDAVEVREALDSQLRELVRSLNPALRSTPEELTSAVAKHLNGKSVEEYGVWIHYPWSRRLVHLLDEAEFALVRTDRNRNKITREEQALLATKRVGVIGLSVGQSAALTIALERSFGELRIADFDTLDLSNLNRIRSGVHHLGINKCVNVAREIAEIDPFLKVTCFTDGLTRDNIDRFFEEGGRLDLLIEECDSVDVKIFSRQKAKALRIPVVMDTSDRGMIDVERFDLEPDRPILHGLIDHLDPEDAAKAKTNEEKLPFLAPIAGLDNLSPRMKASLLELNQTVVTWPQLASSVVLGGALVCDASRRILLGQTTASGRWYLDMDAAIAATPVRDEVRSYAGIPILKQEQLTLDLMLERAERLPAPSPSARPINEEMARTIAEAGALAPSAGNMQPWKFLHFGGRVLLFHDASRSASRLDPDGLIPSIALGMSIENMVLKAGSLGCPLSVLPMTDPMDPLVAVFEHLASGPQFNDPANLAATIGLRHSNRKKADGRAIAAAAIDQLHEAVGTGSAHLHVVVEPARLASIAAIAGSAERIRIMNPSGHFEFFQHEVRWTRTDAELTLDGLEVRTLELDAAGGVGLRAASDPKAMDLVRGSGGGKGFEKMIADAIRSSPAVGLISVDELTPRSRLEGGRAAERMWLAATSLGIAVHPISAAIFLGHAALLPATTALSSTERDALRALRAGLLDVFALGQCEPLFMVRLSHAGEASARALRRPIDEMFFSAQKIPGSSWNG